MISGALHPKNAATLVKPELASDFEAFCNAAGEGDEINADGSAHESSSPQLAPHFETHLAPSC